jgi:oligopeptide/dipeptide ABC transporter ATP-binding protein
VAGKREPLQPIPGQVPPAGVDEKGCSFAERCPHAVAACRAGVPALQAVAKGHDAACRLLEGAGA